MTNKILTAKMPYPELATESSLTSITRPRIIRLAEIILNEKHTAFTKLFRKNYIKNIIYQIV